MKIYSDDSLLKFKTTEINPTRTKAQIDGVLAEWGILDIYWHFDPTFKDRDVYVMFKINEVIEGVPVTVPVKIQCPIIWDREKPKGRPPRSEQVNWAISMRAMYHYIYNALNINYAMQSDRTTAFLPYIAAGEHRNLRDFVMERLKKYKALEVIPAEEGASPVMASRGEHVIDAET